MKIMGRLIIILFTIAALAGCSESHKNNQAENTISIAEEALANRENHQIPYKELLYSKSSADYSWESPAVEPIDDEIRDLYEKNKNLAPGGFLLKETDKQYYIVVSIENKSSFNEGFEMKSLAFFDDKEGKSPLLSIEVMPTSNEITTDDYKGLVSISHLISIAKKDLPDGSAIREISMIGS
ncbi:hypothetical protein FHS15_004061 [Paenibacillus castaneae]|uniref:hypothetical protein n=1 Tax=Paenibacillus castaneae TaxID=474957 RepID=UPI000C9AFD83|nr:hypothetical protein [Paenibacillus castaneae]NIK78915.1 hypothetical protein [Paenibacillus castaneae]